MVEYWNNGFERMKSFFEKAGKTEIKISINTFFKPNIPLFQHSIIPLDVSKVNATPLG